jgi:hypothetical protein
MPIRNLNTAVLNLNGTVQHFVFVIDSWYMLKR